jgi:flagellar basal-body rod protein FlgF
MVRGFYTLASGMLTQDRVLSAVSNNMANSSTTGFKTEKVVAKTFGSMVIDRVDGQKTPLGSVTLMTTADKTTTDFSNGTLKETDRTLDFAIGGNGFFAVQGTGGVVYTRSGSFNVDSDGYLVLSGTGRVLGRDGQPIHCGTDNITSDSLGNLSAGGKTVGSIAVYDFADRQALKTVGEGMYGGGNAVAVEKPQIVQKSLESSNTDLSQELTNAISAQRNLQSCSQALKMYDQVLDKATTEIGKV